MIDAPLSSERRNRAPRVLIVEPRRRYLAVIARRLSDLGYRLGMADSVQGAVAEIFRAPADIVLAQLNSDGFCGCELVSMIRGDTVLRDLPILLFAGRQDRSEAARALRIGADGIVSKPFHFEILAARIERELQRKTLIEELRACNRALDARVTERAITLGEIRDRLTQSEAEGARLRALIEPKAA
jgi:DNA-binding response OmpR family regulator